MSLLSNLLCRFLCGRAVCLATLGPGWLRVFCQAHEVKQSLSSALCAPLGLLVRMNISSEDTWLAYLCPCLFCMCGGRGCTCGSQKSAPDIILQVLPTLLLLEQGLAVARTCWLGWLGQKITRVHLSCMGVSITHCQAQHFYMYSADQTQLLVLIQWALCPLSSLPGSSRPL